MKRIIILFLSANLILSMPPHGVSPVWAIAPESAFTHAGFRKTAAARITAETIWDTVLSQNAYTEVQKREFIAACDTEGYNISTCILILRGE